VLGGSLAASKAATGARRLPDSKTLEYRYRWISALTDVPAGLQEIKAGITTPWAHLRPFAAPVTFSVLDWRNPLPEFGDLAVVLLRLARGRAKQQRLPGAAAEPLSPNMASRP
jgi:D-aspartate ligase